MTNETIAVLGGGNTAFAVAASLTLRGCDIALCELPDFAEMVEPIAARRTIVLHGVAGAGIRGGDADDGVAGQSGNPGDGL